MAGKNGIILESGTNELEITGLIVDGVSEDFCIPCSDMQSLTTMVAGNNALECITGVVNRSGRLLIVLDIYRKFTQDEIACFSDEK
jgi:chemotaxis signal transduction protein